MISRTSFVGAMLIFCGLLGSVTPTSSHAYSPDSPPKPASPLDLQKRGRQLRAAVETSYAKLQGSNSLRRDNDLTELVTSFIPIGIAFTDAETILRSAGCTVGPRPSSNSTGTVSHSDDVFAYLVLARNFPSTTKFSVSLRPKTPGDYSVVSTLQAGIAIDSL